LGDNPHNLRPGQELNIMPVDGTYHRWSEGDGLNGVSKFFGVTAEEIIDYPGNNLDPNTIGDWAHPNIEAGTWLIIPGGQREFVSWSAPEIPRDNPGVARVLGPGACGAITDGAIGVGVFIWPANAHFLSGFDFSPGANHFGIDIDGETGDPVYAADNGVVVYAGWNNWGYGNVVVINHGNGWQTLYAHLDTFYVSCGQSVYRKPCNFIKITILIPPCKCNPTQAETVHPTPFTPNVIGLLPGKWGCCPEISYIPPAARSGTAPVSRPGANPLMAEQKTSVKKIPPVLDGQGVMEPRISPTQISCAARN
jgi:hypothetical protein